MSMGQDAGALRPVAGDQRVELTPVQSPPREWAEALIVLDDVEPIAADPTAVRRRPV